MFTGPDTEIKSRVSTKRIVPPQSRKAAEVGVVRLKFCLMFNRQCRQMKVGSHLAGNAAAPGQIL